MPANAWVSARRYLCYMIATTNMTILALENEHQFTESARIKKNYGIH